MTTVAVTTDEHRSNGMAAELVAVGLQPVALPCVEVRAGRPEAIARARAAAEEADLVVLASSRPLDVIWQGMTLPHTPFAVEGPATASAVAHRGGTVAFAGRGGALDLASELVETVAGKRVAFPHAAGIDPRAVVTLADAAKSLVAVAAYAVVPASPPPGAVDAAVFVSPAAVEGWALSRTFEGLTVGAMGPSTLGALRRHGRSPEVVGHGQSYSALTQRLALFLS